MGWRQREGLSFLEPQMGFYIVILEVVAGWEVRKWLYTSQKSQHDFHSLRLKIAYQVKGLSVGWSLFGGAQAVFHWSIVMVPF